MEAVTLGRYRIVREIARGAMGIVFEAEDPALGRTVALKVLKEGDADEKLVKRLHREALAAAKLRHPNIITIHDVGSAGPVHYFAMDYIAGPGLDRALDEGTMPVVELVQILEDVARAVHHAHENGIVHRDLKPANILLDPSGRPVVTDFGLAKEIDGIVGITRTGAAVGTPQYMAPEQVRAESSKIGPRTDVWALGVLLYQMLSGRLPFQGENIATVFHAILTDEPPPPSKIRPVDQDLEYICLRAIEKHPEFRYPTALDLAEDLRRWRNREPVTARAVPTLRRVRQRLRRHPVAVAAAATALVILAAGFPLAFWQWREGRRAADAAETARTREAARQSATPYFESGRRQFENVRAMTRSLPRRQELLAALAETEKALRRAIAIDPEFADAHSLLGQTLGLRYVESREDRALEEADAHLRRASDLNPALTGAHLSRGNLHVERYLLLRRAPSLTLAADGSLRPEPPLPESEEARRSREIAVTEFDKADHPATPRSELLFARGKLAFAQGQFGLAVSRLDEAVRLDPANAESWLVLGLARSCGGDMIGAQRDFSEALRWRPKYPRALGQRGLCRYAQGRYKEALDDFNAADELVEEPALLVARALCLRRQEPPRLEEAEHDLTRAIERDGSHLAALILRGEIRRLRRHFDGAICDWKEVVRLSPENAPAFLNLGAVSLETREYDAAIGYFTRALDLRPGYGTALYNRAQAWARKGDWERAVADVTRVIEINAEDADAWNERGVYREELFGRTKEKLHLDGALADYDRAITLESKHALARYNRAVLRESLSRPWEALEDFWVAAPGLRESVEPRLRALLARLAP